MEHKFIQELQEARAFKRLSLVNGSSVDSIIIKVLNFLLALKLLYYENEAEAIKYAKLLVNQQSYSGFKTSQPDLYNALVLVFKQDQYSTRVIETDVKVPELRIKRNIRNMGNGTLDENDYNEMLIMILRRAKGLDSLHWKLRRLLSDYSNVSNNEKAQIFRFLMLLMRKNELIYPDLYVLLQQTAKKNKIPV